jgi:hypothetical protein
METIKDPADDIATNRLAAELADVEASVTLVASGVASRITLTGLHFGQELTELLAGQAATRGVLLEASFWPDDTCGDVRVSHV